MTKVSMNYVGVLKDILKLDYGPLHILVIILQCEWMKRQDNQGNPTYTKDDIGFLIVNFCHKFPQMKNPSYSRARQLKLFFPMLKKDLVEKLYCKSKHSQGERSGYIRCIYNYYSRS
jgi:hypothetical protein